MRRIPWLVLPVLLACAACGREEAPPPTAAPSGGDAAPAAPAPGDSPEERAAAALREIFALAPKGDAEAGARHVVYRGPDRARKWKDLSDPSQEIERKYVVSVLGTIARLLEAGPPAFLDFRQETQSEGTWHGWSVRFGEGERAKTARFGLLEVKGRLALGDID